MLAGGNNITLSGATAGGGMTLSVAAGAGGGGATLSRTIIPDHQFSGTLGAAIVNGSMSIQYAVVPQYVTVNSAFAYAQVTVNTAANNSSAYFDYSLSVGLYTRLGSTLNLASSGVGNETISFSSNTTLSVVGPRIFRCAINANMTPGEYYIMYNLSTNNTATGGANTTALANTVSVYGASQIATGTANIFNAAPFGQTTHSTNDIYFGMGLYSVTTGVVPAVISLEWDQRVGHRAPAREHHRRPGIRHMKPQILLPDVGVHHRDLAATRDRVIRGASYRDLSTVCVIPSRGGRSLYPRVVQAWLNMQAPMNQKFMRMFITDMEVGEAYSAAIETILANPELSTWQYVLCCEDDNAPPPDGLLKLYESIKPQGPYDAVGGCISRRAKAVWRRSGAILPTCRATSGRSSRCPAPWCPAMGWARGFLSTASPCSRTRSCRARGSRRQQTAGQTFSQDLYFSHHAVGLGYEFAVDCRMAVGHFDGETMW